MIKVQIVDGHNAVEVRKVTNKTTGEIKDYFNQFGYAELPDSMYPQKIKIPIESPAHAYPVGDYSLSTKSFRIGRFDSLEVNPFAIYLDKFQGNK